MVDYLRMGAEIATMVLALVALLTSIYVPIQLFVIKREGKAARTCEYVKRYNDPSFLKSERKMLLYLRDSSLSEDEKWQEFMNLNKPELKEMVFQVLSFYEEMGAMYKDNLIDRKLIKRLLALPLSLNYSELTWFIDRLRQQPGNQDGCKDWEDMVKDMERP